MCVRMCFFSMLGFLQRMPHSPHMYLPLPRPRTYTYSSLDLYLRRRERERNRLKTKFLRATIYSPNALNSSLLHHPPSHLTKISSPCGVVELFCILNMEKMLLATNRFKKCPPLTIYRGFHVRRTPPPFFTMFTRKSRPSRANARSGFEGH